MEPTQGNTNNSNNTGISGFGNSTPIQPPVPAPKPNPAPVPSAPATQTGSIQVQSAPVSLPPVPAAAPPPMPVTPPPASQTPPAAPVANIDPNQNFKDKTIVGGVEEPPVKRMFTLPFQKDKNKPKEAVTTPPVAPPPAPAPVTAVPTPPSIPPTAPSYNEVTAPGKKNQMAMIAIVAGVVLLLAAAGGYYYLNFMNQPEPVEQEPVVEVPVVVEDTVMDQDPYILQLIQLESTASAQPATLMEHLESIDLEETNLELTGEISTNPDTMTIEEEPLPAPESQPETPIP